jgi:hypothetical protein
MLESVSPVYGTRAAKRNSSILRCSEQRLRFFANQRKAYILAKLYAPRIRASFRVIR